MYKGERFNSISHLVGAALALIGLGALLTIAIQTNDAATIISFSIFGLTLVLLYTMSTLYHSFHPPRIKRVFQKLDHITIYLLIAGTYTPYMVVGMGNNTGYQVLALVWGLAIAGMLLDIFVRRRIEWLQCGIYLSMGWVCAFHYNTLAANIPTSGMIWLTVGGIAYTLGIVFYFLDNINKLRHAHGIWHLFVLTGSLTHFVSVAGYVR